MIPRPEALDGTMFDTVRFSFIRKPVEHMHEIDYPVVGSTLTVLVDAQDGIQMADLRETPPRTWRRQQDLALC